MGRAPCCEKVGLKRGRWTAEEDEILTKYIQANGEGSWRSLPKNAGLLRCGKSCRLRWINYLRSDLKRGNFSPEEEELIMKLHAALGNKWSLIAGNLPGRTDNEIKNYWNSHLSRKIHTFRRPVGSISDPVPALISDAAQAASTKKRRGRRTSRASMKKNKANSAIKLPPPPPETSLDIPKDNGTEVNHARVQMPSTPTLEKEPLTSAVSWEQEKLTIIVGSGPDPPESGGLVLEAFEPELWNEAAGEWLENSPVSSNVNETMLDREIMQWEEIANGTRAWEEDANVLSWLWNTSSGCNGEEDCEGTTGEMDVEKHNAMVAWLFS